jgi:hypothetical protein
MTKPIGIFMGFAVIFLTILLINNLPSYWGGNVFLVGGLVLLSFWFFIRAFLLD